MCRRLAVAAALALLALPAAAPAKAPPKGTYDCTIGGILFDSVRITGATSYVRFGKKGVYGTSTRPSTVRGVKGYRISFRTGAFKGFKGRWYRTTPPGYEIALRNPRDDFESIYCGRRR